MVETEIRDLIQRELPHLIAEDPGIRDFILRTVSEYYTPRDEFSDRFDRILAELQRDREEQRLKWDEQNRKWEEQNRKWDEQRLEDARKWEEQRLKWEEQNRKWDEQRLEDARKWEEQNRKWDEQRLEDARKWEEQRLERERDREQSDRRYKSTIGALGSRWGVCSEASFRNGLQAILTESFGVEVLNLQEKDPEGEVFGRPDQVELDVITHGSVIFHVG